VKSERRLVSVDCQVDPFAQSDIANLEYIEQANGAQGWQCRDDVSGGRNTRRFGACPISPNTRVGEKSGDSTLANRRAIYSDLIDVIGEKLFGSHRA
jgi:hypothetical protein